MQKIRWFFLVLMIGLALAMGLQNNNLTEFRLLWVKQTLPLSVMLLLTSGIGFLFGAVLTASMLRNRKPAKKEKPAEVSTSKPAPTADEPVAADGEQTVLR